LAGDVFEDSGVGEHLMIVSLSIGLSAFRLSAR